MRAKASGCFSNCRTPPKPALNDDTVTGPIVQACAGDSARSAASVSRSSFGHVSGSAKKSA